MFRDREGFRVRESGKFPNLPAGMEEGTEVMKSIRSKGKLVPAALLTAAVFATVLVAPRVVRAEGRHGGWHHENGWHRHDDDGLWWVAAGALLLSVPFWYAFSQPQPRATTVVVRPQPVVVQSGPQVPWYVSAEKFMGSAQPVSPNQSRTPTWYHCDNPSGYYPYVSQCPGGWQAVPAAPSSAPPGP